MWVSLYAKNRHAGARILIKRISNRRIVFCLQLDTKKQHAGGKIRIILIFRINGPGSRDLCSACHWTPKIDTPVSKIRITTVFGFSKVSLHMKKATRR